MYIQTCDLAQTSKLTFENFKSTNKKSPMMGLPSSSRPLKIYKLVPSMFFNRVFNDGSAHPNQHALRAATPFNTISQSLTANPFNLGFSPPTVSQIPTVLSTTENIMPAVEKPRNEFYSSLMVLHRNSFNKFNQ